MRTVFADTTCRRGLAPALALALTLGAGCGMSTVVDADLGDSGGSGSFEVRRRIDRMAGSCVLRASRLSGRGTAEVYGVAGGVECSAESDFASLAAEWPLGHAAGRAAEGAPRHDAAFGLSLAVLAGRQGVTYDPGTGETTVRGGWELLGAPAPGVYVAVPIGARASLRAAQVYGGVVDEVASETLVELRVSVFEGVSVTAGWRRLEMTTVSDTVFPTGSSGTQVVRTSSRGFTLGLCLRL